MAAPSTDEIDPEEFPALLERARSGNRQALNDLFERYYPRVRELAHAKLEFDARRGRPWLSARFSTSDVVQDVFRSVLSHLDAFGGRTEDAFVGYLAMLVRNRIVDAVRFHQSDRRDGRQARARVDDREHESDAPRPDRAAQQRDSVEQLYRLIAEFPERERLLVRARLEGTATFEELTERLGYSSVTTARRTFFELQARLALRLEDSDEGGSK